MVLLNIFQKNPVIAVFAMKQKIKATKELSLFTDLVEMSVLHTLGQVQTADLRGIRTLLSHNRKKEIDPEP